LIVISILTVTQDKGKWRVSWSLGNNLAHKH
jgi:hypothetical protein